MEKESRQPVIPHSTKSPRYPEEALLSADSAMRYKAKGSSGYRDCFLAVGRDHRTLFVFNKKREKELARIVVDSKTRVLIKCRLCSDREKPVKVDVVQVLPTKSATVTDSIYRFYVCDRDEKSGFVFLTTADARYAWMTRLVEMIHDIRGTESPRNIFEACSDSQTSVVNSFGIESRDEMTSDAFIVDRKYLTGAGSRKDKVVKRVRKSVSRSIDKNMNYIADRPVSGFLYVNAKEYEYIGAHPPHYVPPPKGKVFLHVYFERIAAQSQPTIVLASGKGQWSDLVVCFPLTDLQSRLKMRINDEYGEPLAKCKMFIEPLADGVKRERWCVFEDPDGKEAWRVNLEARYESRTIDLSSVSPRNKKANRSPFSYMLHVTLAGVSGLPHLPKNVARQIYYKLIVERYSKDSSSDNTGKYEQFSQTLALPLPCPVDKYQPLFLSICVIERQKISLFCLGVVSYSITEEIHSLVYNGSFPLKSISTLESGDQTRLKSCGVTDAWVKGASAQVSIRCTASS